jgi:site-specific recombinase XerD
VLTDAAAAYEKRARSDSTRRAYAADWRHFAAWCGARGHQALPASPETVRLYLSDHAKRFRPATLSRRLVAISQVHQEKGEEPPTRANAVRKVLSGIRRAEGTAQDAKAPLLADDVKAIIEQLPTTVLWGVRDRCLLLLGFAAGLRRSELVGLDVADVQHTREGLIVTIRRSKTDQEGEGHKVGVPPGRNAVTCPVRAYRAWLEASGIKRGPVFRPIDRHGNLSEKRLAGEAVADIVKSHVKRIGLDEHRYAGHSLRAGLATTAALSGVSERAIAKVTRHRSMEVLRRYIRDGEMFRDSAAGTGL